MDLLFVTLLLTLLGGYSAFTVVDIAIDMMKERKIQKRGQRILRGIKAA